MNAIRLPVLVLLASLSLAGCSDDSSAPAAQGQQEPGLLGKAVREATDKARDELATNSIDLDATGHPKAQIAPNGDFIVGGKPVAIDDAQRKLLLEYRAGITTIAAAGIDIGVQGADLAGKAVTEALAGVFTGKSDEVEKKIEGHAEGIKQAAVKLCTKLPALLDTQNRLAAALPAFQPYATMSQQDIDDCNKDGNINLDLPGSVHVAADVGADGGHHDDAASEAEAAAADAPKDAAASEAAKR